MLAIIVMFELPQHRAKCLFLLISKAAIMITSYYRWLTYKNSTLQISQYYNQCPSFHRSHLWYSHLSYFHCFSGLVVANSNSFSKICYYCFNFYTLDIFFLPRSICKLTALLKGQIPSWKHIFKSLLFSIIEFAYYIAKNLSTLRIFWAKLCLLPSRFL